MLTAINNTLTIMTSINNTQCILFFSTDINECDQSTDNCDEDAECTNTEGSFQCTCNDGFDGDGVSCSGMSFL